jgi:preprotein translocase subunit YajC
MDPMLIIMMVGMLGLLFFMQSRAKKQAAQRDAFRSQLTVGQRVMTQGGLVGTIVAINDAADTVVLDSAGSRCEYMRQGIAKTLDDAVITPGASGVGSTLASTGSTTTTPAAGGFLANALGNLNQATNAGPSVTDADLAELDAVSRDYYESRGGDAAVINDGAASAPIVVLEED